MIAVLQRVSAASVTVEGDTNVAVESDTNVAVESDTNVAVESDTKAEIGAGFVALVGVRKGDDEHAAERLARKVATLRVFGDERGLSIAISFIPWCRARYSRCPSLPFWLIAGGGGGQDSTRPRVPSGPARFSIISLPLSVPRRLPSRPARSVRS